MGGWVVVEMEVGAWKVDGGGEKEEVAVKRWVLKVNTEVWAVMVVVISRGGEKSGGGGEGRGGDGSGGGGGDR